MSLSLLTPPATTELHQPNHTRVLKRHQLIPSCRDLLWQIERGVVRTTTVTEDGVLIILGYWGTGDVVGYAMSRLEAYQIECLSEVQVSLLPQAQWNQQINALLRHIQELEQLLSIIHHNPVQQRLWQFLTFLAQKFGVDVEQGVLINLNLTHQAIAEIINVTRVTVTRLLQKFEYEGLLLRQQRQLILLR
jgi:CRP-like cAMP-binding protein